MDDLTRYYLGKEIADQREDEDWKMWRGVEVEGRLAGVPTLFMDAGVYLPDALLEERVHHYYLTAGCVEESGWEAVIILCRQVEQPVTLEVTPRQLGDMPAYLSERCHIMLSLDVPQMSRLKDTDTVKLVMGAYDVFCITPEQMVHTVPSDYLGDERIDVP